MYGAKLGTRLPKVVHISEKKLTHCESDFQGEAIILHSKDWESEDMSEISQRLKAVTNGAPTQEFTLRRNQLGQLGFHVQHDGLITEVCN